MAPVLFQAVRRSLGQSFTLRRAEDVLAVPPERKRPRELTMLRASCKLVETAANAFVASWRSSGEPESAALDAERLARSLAAQDVRTLVSLDGGRTLTPYAGRFEKTAGPLVGYLAVKLAGYWADVFLTAEETPSPAARHAADALDTLIAAVKPGARSGPLHRGGRGVGAVSASSGPQRQYRSRHWPITATSHLPCVGRCRMNWPRTASIRCKSASPTPKPAMLSCRRSCATRRTEPKFCSVRDRSGE